MNLGALAVAFLLAAPAAAQVGDVSAIEAVTGKKFGKGPKSAAGKAVDKEVAAPLDFEAAYLKGKLWEINAEARDGLDEAVWEQVHVLSKVDADAHVTIRQEGGRNNREQVPFLQAADKDAKRRQGAVRGVGKHLATTTEKGDVLYLDLTNRKPVPDRSWPGSQYAVAGKVLDKSVHVFEASLLEDAMAAAGFSKEDAAKAKTNLASAMVQLGSPKSYLLMGEKTSRLVLQPEDSEKKLYFWPTISED